MTAGEVAGGNLAKHRWVSAAAGLGEGAAGVELAGLGAVGEARDLAF